MCIFRPTKDQAKSSEVQSTDKSNESKDMIEDSVSSISPATENKTSKATESQSKPKLTSTVTENDSLPSENTIRVTHIKENKKSDPECSKRNITSPLSVEVCILYGNV